VRAVVHWSNDDPPAPEKKKTVCTGPLLSARSPLMHGGLEGVLSPFHEDRVP